MTAEFLVVHLVSSGVAGVRSGWDTPDGAVRHEVVSWRESPATLTRADMVVAHGLAPLVVAQSIIGAGPKLVYRPFDATRPTRRRLRGGLRADWVAAPTRRIGRKTAGALRLDANHVTVFRTDDRAAWDIMTTALLDRHAYEAVEPATAATVDRDEKLQTDAGPAADSGPETGAGSELEPPGRPVLPWPVAPASSAIRADSASVPPLLGVGVAEPNSPGHPWWMYRRMEMPPAGNGGRATQDEAARPRSSTGASSNGVHSNGASLSASHAAETEGADTATVQLVVAEERSGVAFFALGAAVLVGIAVGTQLGTTGEAIALVPIAGLLLTLAVIRRVARRRPDEAWTGRWLLLGFFAKLSAVIIYNHIYKGKGDQVGYDAYGRRFAKAWLTGGAAPKLPNRSGTNFLRWITGVIYYVFGSNLLTGALVFGLLAFAGSYLWWRATVDAVPSVNPKLYLVFVLFAPSILFWPATVGKEALMQFGLGVLALGVSFIVRQRLVPGFLLSAGGGWLVWAVRPHLLALVAVAAGAAYLAGRVRKDGKERAGLLGRPIGVIIIAFLVAFTIGQGANFLGIKSLSFNSIQQELDQESATTTNGNSSFHKSTGNSLNPTQWPTDAVTVFLRPFPWEIDSGLQITASMESVLLAILLVVRFKSLRIAFTRSRESPFLMFCWVLSGLYAIAFSSFSNFGLLVRERSLVLPALLVLLSVEPKRDRLRRERAPATDTEPLDDRAAIPT